MLKPKTFSKDAVTKKIANDFLNSWRTKACRPRGWKGLWGYGNDSEECFMYRSTKLGDLMKRLAQTEEAGKMDLVELKFMMKQLATDVPLVTNKNVLGIRMVTLEH